MLKNITFIAGLTWLLIGAAFFDYPDWDYGVSVTMAVSTYCLAQWCVDSWMELRWRRWPATVLATWWCVDGSYWLYWSQVRPEVMIREGQWPMSLCLFLLCGFLWRYTAHLVPLTSRELPTRNS